MLMATTACPYCGVEMEVPSENVMRSSLELTKDNALGAKTFVMVIEICPNLRCRGVRAGLSMYPMREDNRGTLRLVLDAEREWQLIPVGARALPEYVPAQVRREYEEASAVRVVSPNAAATLARRCLQMMIRDFWGITKGMLSAEIDALKEKVEPETWGAIESVRRNGQIGAHLDKGANLILEADPAEPEVLLSLIEYLIEDWYVARRQAPRALVRATRDRAADESAPVTAEAVNRPTRAGRGSSTASTG